MNFQPVTKTIAFQKRYQKRLSKSKRFSTLHRPSFMSGKHQIKTVNVFIDKIIHCFRKNYNSGRYIQVSNNGTAEIETIWRCFFSYFQFALLSTRTVV